VPDILAATRDGITIIDVSLAARLSAKPSLVAACEASAAAVASLGWSYTLVVGEEIDQILIKNLRWLMTCRREPWNLDAYADEVLDAADGATLAALTAAVGDPMDVRPVVFHLLWHQKLTANLRAPLSDDTPLFRAPSPDHDAPRPPVDLQWLRRSA
jgi:hypothetical protein